ncbi:3'-5' DNA helicase [Claviceps africana]|uniref:ATP-dependent DNA helicase n=1 Tax=Claviceps africana TaxID=83212 RepID=A0A8K0JDW1_9HYPO|nr:3'-5' DNA helicase [Claviceps africana]
MDDDDFSDDFSDDIADEDLFEALNQTSSSVRAHSSSNTIPRESQQRRKPDSFSAAAEVLENLPSDAFSSPEPEFSGSGTAGGESGPSKAFRDTTNGPRQRNGLARTGSASFRQTTLFGTVAQEMAPPLTQNPSQRVYIADRPREVASHHEMDREAMQTWVYPTNLGAIRDYQFSIVKNSLFNNTLVALPTGLGKTFIAATVMLNFYRWTRSAKIVFVAPTKPLVAQQVDACYNIVGIPRSDTTLLTGDIPPALRVDEWETKRVFFMTPQTLLNDVSHGYADPKSIALIVVDEAHRAVGEYAYAKVVKLIRRFSDSFRILALTATPGSKVETVQEVIDNLGISHCEIRTEESLDIRQYVHDRNIKQVVLDPSDEMNLISELFTQSLRPLMDKLSSQNIYYGRNPMAMTTYGLMQAQKEWFGTRGRHANQGVQFMMRAIFSVLTSLAHSIKLLNFHGIKPFYDNMVDFRSEQEGRGEKGSKYKRQIIEHAGFQKMMDKISGWLKIDGFVGHPKLTALADCVLNHFMDQGEGSATRVIVFSEYRDSAEDIVRELNKHQPLLKASVFVGQADGKRGEGMKQAQQIQTIDRFKKGEFNILVATSIGEEGLDIGQVDLIVCYDSSASPIRMLQRMGRTGRKRAGNIVLLLMRGKEEDQFAKSKDSYEKMQKLICEGSRFNFRFDLSSRIVPREIRPEVDKRHVEIPFENTQNSSLPEPKKRRAQLAGKKKPPKKFHMPDGVETGFQTLSHYMNGGGTKSKREKPAGNPELDDVEDIPDLNAVVLSGEELKELDRAYRDMPFNHSVVEETDMPSMSAFPLLQRQLRPVVYLKHGTQTERIVKLLAKIAREPSRLGGQRDFSSGNSSFKDIPVKPFFKSDGEESEGEDEECGSGAAKRRETSTASTGRQTKRRKTKPISNAAVSRPEEADVSSGDGNDDDSVDDDNDHEAPHLHRGQTSRNRKKTKGQRKKSKATWEARGDGITSNEIGDDCERDSDVMESSGLDDGADLLDFVVADTQATSGMTRDSLPVSPITASPRHMTPTLTSNAVASRPFYVPTRFSATQESDDIPDLDTLIGRPTINRPVADEKDSRGVSDFNSDPDDVNTKRAARGRRQILDSDSDE